MWVAGLEQFVPFLVTVLAIVFTDLLTGVLIGVVFGIFFVIRTNHHSAFTVVQQDAMYLLRFNKDASFVNKSELKRKLSAIPPHSTLIIDGTKAGFIDRDVYDVMIDFAQGAPHKDIILEYKHFHDKSQSYSARRRIYGII
jgi:MFS superfamily sulfate permease-like transporter